MACNERGMALVSVLLMLTVLLILAHILTEKIWQSTHQAADAANREQVFWAAQAGIEAARQQLADSYSSSAGWQTLLTADTIQVYPAAPAWVTEVNGFPVEIYLRDNPDGDGDVRNDNDLKIFVLARARGRRGAETMIESLCGFDLSATAGSAPTAGSGGSQTNLSDEPVSTYGVAD
jgi:type II secretory pathway pseudopilin PulG